ncbi:MAG TPA: zinc ribbon domain-containing protein [bacterium]|nr:zinc ribbon domain-containing protein [bacterium]
MPFCLNCGSEVADTDAFCLSCGAKQDQNPVPAQNAASPSPAPAQPPAPKNAAPAPSPQTGEPAKSKKKRKKKSGLGCLIKLIIILALLGGGAYASWDYYRVHRDKTTDTTLNGFVEFWLEQTGLQKKEETTTDDVEDKDVDSDADKDTSRDEDDDTTGDDTQPDKTFWYDQYGDIEDKDGKRYLKMYTDKDLYYQPESKKVYEASATKLTAKTSDAVVYYSSKYNFMLVFPKGWKDLKTQVETVTDDVTGEKLTFIDFQLPTTDTTYQVNGKLATVFGIEVVSKTYYNQLRNDPEAYDDGVSYVGTFGNLGYIAYADGGYPDDLEKRINELQAVFDTGFTFHKAD